MILQGDTRDKNELYKLMNRKNHATYLNDEIAGLEDMLSDYMKERAELKAKHQSTKLIASKIRLCKKAIRQDQESLAAVEKLIAEM